MSNDACPEIWIRFALWWVAFAVSLLLDVTTKALPHPTILNHYDQVPGIVALPLAAFLLFLGLSGSRLLAVGTGLMLGGLAGNAGQIMLFGYASDWIPVDGYRTNIADIMAGVGLLLCLVAYVRRF